MRADQDAERRTLFERAVLPIAIPIVVLVVIELIVLPFSQILLAVGKTPAVFVALGAALAILGVAAVVSASPRVKSGTLVGLLALGGIAVIAGGLWAAQAGYAPLEGEHGAGAGATVEITADNIAFDESEIALPAGQPSEIVFDNQDEGIPHNVAIYRTEAAEDPLFVGEIFDGPEQRTYQVPALDEGEYYFHCDVHPNMNGTVVVEESEAAAGH